MMSQHVYLVVDKVQQVMATTCKQCLQHVHLEIVCSTVQWAPSLRCERLWMSVSHVSLADLETTPPCAIWCNQQKCFCKTLEPLIQHDIPWLCWT